MENFQQKKLVTRRSLCYTYYVSSFQVPAVPQSTLLFLHGFPDSAHLWCDVVVMLGNMSIKIIIPDCLGYAGTDKPNDTSLYLYRGQAEDLFDILKSENATSTVIIGHDWGAALAQRTYLHKPELFNGMKGALGYPQLSYWEFFLASDAPDVVENNLDKMWQVLHGDMEDWVKRMFCVRGAMRSFLLGNQEVPLKEYAQQRRWKDRFMQQFRPGEFGPALQMYKAIASNVQTVSDRSIPKANLTIKVPLLFIGCTKDAVCTPEMMDQPKKLGLVPKLKEVRLDCAHWSPMERPGEIAQHIKDFLVEISLSH